MAYIIDTYNKYDEFDRMHARKVFQLNDNWYAIKEVELEWGKPKFPFYATHDKNEQDYFIYDTYEQALGFVLQMKSLN